MHYKIKKNKIGLFESMRTIFFCLPKPDSQLQIHPLTKENLKIFDEHNNFKKVNFVNLW